MQEGCNRCGHALFKPAKVLHGTEHMEDEIQYTQ